MSTFHLALARKIVIPFYGIWLLLICIFEDTADWSNGKLLIFRRTFAVVMILLVLSSLVFIGLAIAQEPIEARVARLEHRLEVRIDRADLEHRDIFHRLATLEANIQSFDRMANAVIALSIAVIGQWIFQLSKIKLRV